MFLVLFLIVLSVSVKSSFLGSPSPSSIWRIYHNQVSLTQLITDLGSCNGYLSKKTINEDPFIEVLTIQKSEESLPIEYKNKRQKVFLLFGEHSRELIAQETGIHFLQALCDNESFDFSADSLLNKNIFQIVYNANPNGRKHLEEKSDFDKRSNGNNVDTNRNWAINFRKTATSITKNLLIQKQTYPGPSAFSEPESREIAKAINLFKPRIFLTLHSGASGLYMPYAYKQDKISSPHFENMFEILTAIKTKYCNFSGANFIIGQLAKVLYQVSGNCLDYVFECLGAEYAFAWEIYGGNEESGFTAFNPSGQERYNQEINRWKNAIAETLELIYQKPIQKRNVNRDNVCNTGINDIETSKIFNTIDN